MPLKVAVQGKNGGSRSRTKDAPMAWAASYTGPRQENQDYYGRADQETSHYDWQNRGCLYVLADGMGGLTAGAKAAQMAVKEVIDQYRRSDKDAPVAQNLTEAIRKANRKIYAAGQSKGGRMGSTIVACVLKDGTATIAHAGDSRAYVLSDGNLKRLTTDHLFAKEVLGIANDDDAKRNPEGHKITRALGKDPEIQIEPTDGEYSPEDRFLLCSDGFSEVLEEDEIKECLSEPAPQKVVHTLISAAGNRLTDNATAVVAFASGRSIRRRQKIKKSSFAVAMLLLAAALGSGGWWGWNHGGKGIFDSWIGRTNQGDDKVPFTISTNNLTFEEQSIEHPPISKSVTVTNDGKSELHIQTNISPNVIKDFKVASECEDPLPVGQKCTIDVRFAPIKAGSRTGQLNITGNGKTVTVNMVGTRAAEEKVTISVVNDTAKPIVFWKKEDSSRPMPLLPKHSDQLVYDSPLTNTERLCWRYKTDKAGLRRGCEVVASKLVTITDEGTKPEAYKTLYVSNETGHWVKFMDFEGQVHTLGTGLQISLPWPETATGAQKIVWWYRDYPNARQREAELRTDRVAIQDMSGQYWNELRAGAPDGALAPANAAPKLPVSTLSAEAKTVDHSNPSTSVAITTTPTSSSQSVVGGQPAASSTAAATNNQQSASLAKPPGVTSQSGSGGSGVPHPSDHSKHPEVRQELETKGSSAANSPEVTQKHSTQIPSGPSMGGTLTIRNDRTKEIEVWAEGYEEVTFNISAGKKLPPVSYSIWQTRPTKVCWRERITKWVVSHPYSKPLCKPIVNDGVIIEKDAENPSPH